jgi:hypothetical protein
VFAAHEVQAICGFVQSLFPADFFPIVTASPEGLAQSVWVLVELPQGQGFWAEVTFAVGVGCISFNGAYTAIIQCNGKAAHGFTERAGSVRGLAGHRNSISLKIGQTPSPQEFGTTWEKSAPGRFYTPPFPSTRNLAGKNPHQAASTHRRFHPPET